MTDHDAQHAAAHVAAYQTTFATRSAELLDLLYEPGAVLVPQPGRPFAGAAQRLAAHRHLLGFGLPMEAHARHVYTAGDLALLIVDWSMRGTGPHGHPVDLSGTATDVVRRGPGGRWRYVIDNPFGTA
jgi:ketosteroid isomerase-like protein